MASKTRKISKQKGRFFNDIENEPRTLIVSPFESYPSAHNTQRVAYEKMNCLKAISNICNFNHQEITDKELTLCLQLTLLINLPNVHPIRLAAAVSGLDLLFPKWRDSADKAIISKISDRNSKHVAYWKKQCLKRDNRTCVSCGSARNITVHHILSWADYPELRLNVSNGQTLCGDCHHKEHPNMGYALFVKKGNQNA